jgi:hypothetical protein
MPGKIIKNLTGLQHNPDIRDYIFYLLHNPLSILCLLGDASGNLYIKN